MAAVKHPFSFGKLLTGSYKTDKSNKAGTRYFTKIMYMIPHKKAGLGVNLCASASPGCIASCLVTAGRGAMGNVHKGRLERTKLWVNDPNSFKVLLAAEITENNMLLPRGKVLAVRLNGTSDIMWEKEFPGLMGTFSNVQFYDYTKHYKRMCRYIDGELPKNYHLTFSRSETNEKQAKDIAKRGGNVAVVFRKQLPEEWYGRPVYDMDKTDLRFLDPAGVGGLIAKGKARKDNSGFVVDH